MQIIDLLINPKYQNKKVIEILITRFLGISREQVHAYHETDVPSEIIDQIDEAYTQYAVHKKPLEYIFQEVEFFQIKFYLDNNTLIPRPETEYLILQVNKYIQENISNKFTLIDVGTGCGVLGILAIYFNQSNITNAYLTDIRDQILQIAQQNAQKIISNFSQIVYLKANLLDFLILPDIQLQEHIIVSANLPYIPDQVFDTEVEDNVKKREPRDAFVGGVEGLDYYFQMFEQVILWKQQNTNHQISFFIETTHKQAEILVDKYQNNFKIIITDTFHVNIKILVVV